jgi:type IV pilus assembly protein PilE
MRRTGFTLIELMIAVAIAAILLSLAIPAYNRYIRQSRRNDARSALVDLAGREERYFNTNGNTYTTNLNSLGYGTVATPTMTVGSGYYSVVLLPGASGSIATSYLITAVPITVDQLKDTNCLYFSIDNTGLQLAGTPAVANSLCWSH